MKKTWSNKIPTKNGLYWINLHCKTFDEDYTFVLDVAHSGKHSLIHGPCASFYFEENLSNAYVIKVSRIKFGKKYIDPKKCTSKSKIFQIKHKSGHVGIAYLENSAGSFVGNVVFLNNPDVRSISGFTMHWFSNYADYKMFPISPPKDDWSVYMIKSKKDNSIYTGISNDVYSRLNAHNNKKGAKYTKSRAPFELLYIEICGSKSVALKREYQIKKLTKINKEKLLLSGDNLLK